MRYPDEQIPSTSSPLGCVMIEKWCRTDLIECQRRRPWHLSVCTKATRRQRFFWASHARLLCLGHLQTPSVKSPPLLSLSLVTALPSADTRRPAPITAVLLNVSGSETGTNPHFKLKRKLVRCRLYLITCSKTRGKVLIFFLQFFFIRISNSEFSNSEFQIQVIHLGCTDLKFTIPRLILPVWSGTEDTDESRVRERGRRRERHPSEPYITMHH